MKKLFTFINMLLAIISNAYRTINRLSNENEKLKKNLNEWKEAYVRNEDELVEKFYQEKDVCLRMKQVLQTLLDDRNQQTDEEWMEEMCYKYFGEEEDWECAYWEEEDWEYADWCLHNNWNKCDDEAGVYVCGEDIWDEDYKEWIEKELDISDTTPDEYYYDCDFGGVTY